MGGDARRAAGQERRLPGRPGRDQPAGADEQRRDRRSYPEFPGTPTFLINGEMVDKPAPAWEQLEPKINEALGG